MAHAPRRLWGALIVVVITLAGALFLLGRLDDRTVAALLHEANYIERGAKFNVSVGMPVDDAARALEQQGLLQRDDSDVAFLVSSGWRCGRRTMQPGETILMFKDETWRSGMICLFEADGRVAAIGWTFSPIELP